MAGPNRKRVAIRAPGDAWARLGDLLTARRIELGYQFRPAFAKDRGLNIRRVQDIENNYRPDTYPAGSLHEIAAAYEVAYESVLAVLRGDTDTLALAPAAAAAGVPAEPARWEPPVADAGREYADRPYADRIWEHLRQLAAQGITCPSGTQVFPDSPPDAKTWDGIGDRWDLPDRVWMIADMQRRASDRQRNGSRGPGSAGRATRLPAGKFRLSGLVTNKPPCVGNVSVR